MAELGLNIPLLIVQTLNFFVILLVLRLFLYKPILGMLDQRAQRIREGLDAADKSKEQAVAAEQDVSRREGGEA